MSTAPAAGARIVAILNVTPDSFATAPLGPGEAVAAAERLLADGADVIDVGAESTRPGAPPVPPNEEWRRLADLPAIVRAAHAAGALVSLDTRHPETAARGLGAGVDWINDVSGGGPAMAAVVAPTGASLVAMHSLSVPPVPGERLDGDAVAIVRAWCRARRDELAAAGLEADRVVFDPGIGFGKSPAQSMALCARAGELAREFPLLVGHSRKSFLRRFAPDDAPPEARDGATLALSALMAAAGVQYLRVHDVAAHRRLLPHFEIR